MRRKRFRRSLVAAAMCAGVLSLAAAPSDGEGNQPPPGTVGEPNGAVNADGSSQPAPGTGTATGASAAPDSDPSAQPANDNPKATGEPTQVDAPAERVAGGDGSAGRSERADAGGVDGSQSGDRADG